MSVEKELFFVDFSPVSIIIHLLLFFTLPALWVSFVTLFSLKQADRLYCKIKRQRNTTLTLNLNAFLN